MSAQNHMDNLPLHKRGVEWLTSHTLWELAKYLVGAAVSAGLVSAGITRIFNAAFDKGLSIFLVLMGVMGMMWVFGLVRWSATASKKEETKWEVFIFSPGLAVSLTPNLGRVIINLHMVSTKTTELVFLRVMLRNNKGTYLDCDSSEPMTVEAMQVTSKIIDKKVPPAELATFEKGELVSLEGSVKFRDGNSLKQFNFTMPTVPSI